ncbi:MULTISPECIES: hypothetical protein [Streptomyces]|uniref:Uncharacterized protein n=1 Tax=Streptomyces chartreusis NRRL 3882 TaxID=1079985 RepID=A0A2N9B7S1_STRCX|nr:MULTISPECIES: hypothetical protein [Streptomyces]MYS94157.1 hypothetical protein [Streptomyces sp. SID5464]SOR79380.1 hypothetical protein SCNRRL3882_2842 [Streptomyces chartreusis NRRL 3882]
MAGTEARVLGRTGVVLAALIVLTAAAGCGSGSDEPAKASSAPGERPSKADPPRRPEPTPKPSVSVADGHDITACADGNCEIAVSEPVKIPFKGPRGPATLSVTEVGPNTVAYTVKSGNGQSKGSVSGPGQGCITVLRSNGSGNSCGGLGDAARPSPQPDAVVIQAAAGEDGTAVLQLVSD